MSRAPDTWILIADCSSVAAERERRIRTEHSGVKSQEPGLKPQRQSQ
ncbi:hypothetical protein K0038_00346 [Pseudomonas syringae]|nr:hypothetical protein [Pseudomonas syringae]